MRRAQTGPGVPAGLYGIARAQRMGRWVLYRVLPHPPTQGYRTVLYRAHAPHRRATDHWEHAHMAVLGPTKEILGVEYAQVTRGRSNTPAALTLSALLLILPCSMAL